MAITFVRFKLIIVAVVSLATCHFAHGLVLPVDHSNTLVPLFFIFFFLAITKLLKLL